MRPRTAAASFAAATLAVIALAGCASTSSTPSGNVTPFTGSPSAAASSAPVAAASSAPSCADQFASWRDNGGLSSLEAVTADLGKLSTAASAAGAAMESGTLDPSAQAALAQAAATLQSDTGTAQADLPPSCVPGLRSNDSAALTDYNRAAVEAGQSVTEADSGSLAVATSDLVAATRSMGAGNKKVVAATKAISAFSG